MTCLRGEVEAQVAGACNLVLNQEWHFVGEADLDLVRKTDRLAEVDEVLEGESERDGLCQLNGDVVIRLVEVGVGAQHDRAVTNVTTACKLNTVLGSLDDDC
jgi:hypothetical protein